MPNSNYNLHAMQFFPKKNFWGGNHATDGIYLDSEKLVVKNVGNAQGLELAIPLKKFMLLKHEALFSFRFYVFFYTTRVVNHIVVLNEYTNAYFIFPVTEFKGDVLLNLFQQLKNIKSDLHTDDVISQAIQTNSTKPITMNYWKAVWKSVRWWFLLLGFFVVPGILLAIFS